MKHLIGNQKAYETLAAFVRGGRLPHAILLEGPEGSGKRRFAREIAAAVLCENIERPCGACRHCVKAEKNIHPDILSFGSEGGSRSFHIETVRDIRAEASVRPNEADAKVFILENVQNMSVQAQNALLKLIEEPPGAVHFVLTCTNKALMLETILSRVTVIALELPSAGECEELLSRLFPDSDGEHRRIAAIQAGGSVGGAIDILKNNAARDSRAEDIVAALLYGSELEALEFLRPFERDRQGLSKLLEQMRILIMAKITRNPGSERISPLRLNKIIAIIDEAAAAVKGNVSGLLLTTLLCSRIRQTLE